MGYEKLPSESFFVISYNEAYLYEQYASNNKGYELLFYINESFSDANQIKDQNLLLCGLLRRTRYQSEMSYVLNNRLLIIDAMIDKTSAEAIGKSWINNYQLPELSSSQLNAIDNIEFIMSDITNFPN